MPWKPLHLSKTASAHLTPLLISATFGDDSYTIYLTDLTNIWSESLSRKDIIHRSQEESTSIDPSDDRRQLKIFLEKIKFGLEGKDGTTSALTINDDDGRPSLTFNLTVKLPGGLPPLEWPVQLAAASQTFLTSQLIVPLVGAQHIRLQERVSLTKVLREKDHVIQKLLDKLESLGTELGDLFPQAAGKAGRKVDRKKAEEKVPGVARFDLEAWRNNSKIVNLSDVSSLISEVFNDEGGKVETGISTEVEGLAEESWWEEIKGLTVNLDTGKISTKRGRSKSQRAKSLMRQTPAKPATEKPQANPVSPLQQRKDCDDDDDDGDFQVQSTPPHLKKGAPTSSNNAVDSATESDDDFDGPSQPSKIPDVYSVSQPPAEPSPSPPPKEQQAPSDTESDASFSASKTEAGKTHVKEIKKTRTCDVSSETKSEAPSPPPKSSTQKEPSLTPPSNLKKLTLGKIGAKKPPPEHSPSAAREESPVPVKKKGKLGQIGGKKKAAPKADTQVSSDSEPVSKKNKLGAIGGRKREASSPTAPNLAEERVPLRSKDSPTQKKPKTPEKPETDQERADKKRAALKRELEEKAKASASVKKKRKF